MVLCRKVQLLLHFWDLSAVSKNVFNYCIVEGVSISENKEFNETFLIVIFMGRRTC